MYSGSRKENACAKIVAMATLPHPTKYRNKYNISIILMIEEIIIAHKGVLLSPIPLKMEDAILYAMIMG